MEGLRLDNGSVAVGAFDFDGNILQAPTLHYYKNTETGKVEEVAGWYVDQNPEIFFGNNSTYALLDNSKESTYRHYRDVSSYSKHRGFNGLRSDVESAIENNDLSPSSLVLKDIFLVKARFLSILTARGNSPDNFQDTLQFISSQLLSEAEKDEQLACIANNFGLSNMSDKDMLAYYFGKVCDYIPCDNTQTKKFLCLDSQSGSVRKTQAMEWYISEVNKKISEIGKHFGKTANEIINSEKPLAVGFSDDSIGNVVEMGKWMSRNFGNLYKGRVYFTGKDEGKRTVIEQLAGVGISHEISQGDNTMLQVKINGSNK